MKKYFHTNVTLLFFIFLQNELRNAVDVRIKMKGNQVKPLDASLIIGLDNFCDGLGSKMAHVSEAALSCGKDMSEETLFNCRVSFLAFSI